MTDGERRLWSERREFRRWYGIHVRRQAPLGPYIVDFVIHEKKQIGEIDGEHHQYPDQLERDARRDDRPRSEGYTVLPLTSGDVWDDLDGCTETILGEVGLP